MQKAQGRLADSPAAPLRESLIKEKHCKYERIMTLPYAGETLCVNWSASPMPLSLLEYSSCMLSEIQCSGQTQAHLFLEVPPSPCCLSGASRQVPFQVLLPSAWREAGGIHTLWAPPPCPKIWKAAWPSCVPWTRVAEPRWETPALALPQMRTTFSSCTSDTPATLRFSFCRCICSCSHSPLSRVSPRTLQGWTPAPQGTCPGYRGPSPRITGGMLPSAGTGAALQRGEPAGHGPAGKQRERRSPGSQHIRPCKF